MIINKRFDYQTVERVTNEDGSRFYTCPVYGTPLPSVTTILSATADKTALIEWQNAVGKKKADWVRDEACNLGTLMHTNLENYIQGIPLLEGGHPLRMQARRMADVIIEKGFPKLNEVWGIEVAMYMPGLYAGMTDLVGMHLNEECIGDHKTTKKMKSFEMIEDYCCQISAYAIAHDHVYGTKMKKGVIYMVARDLKYEEFIVEGNMLQDFKDRWLRRVETYLEANAV